MFDERIHEEYAVLYEEVCGKYGITHLKDTVVALKSDLQCWDREEERLYLMCP